MRTERLILEDLIHNRHYSSVIGIFLKPEYFKDNIEKIIFTEIQKHISEYNKPPTIESLSNVIFAEVIALAEYRPILRRLVATRYNVPRTYSNHKQLLSDKDIEAVVVVTPRQYTAPTVLDCLKAGKHVMSEKPMAGTVEHGEMLVKAAEPNGVRYVVGYMKRYDEGVQTAKNVLKQVIDSKELGQIIYTRTHCFAGDSYCNPSVTAHDLGPRKCRNSGPRGLLFGHSVEEDFGLTS